MPDSARLPVSAGRPVDCGVSWRILRARAGGEAVQESLDLRTARDAAEKKTIIAALGRVDGNIVKAAELLGVSRPTLYDLMHRLGLK